MDEANQLELVMQEDMNSLKRNKILCLIDLPSRNRTLQNKWVFKVKEEHDDIKIYKARLVVKGFQPKKGIDYNEIFSHIIEMTTIRLVLSIVVVEDLHLANLDVKTTFLHGDLDENIYMVQLEGFQVAGNKTWFAS